MALALEGIKRQFTGSLCDTRMVGGSHFVVNVLPPVFISNMLLFLMISWIQGWSLGN